MTYLSSILILLAGSLLVSASPIPDANPEPVPALNNAERVMRGLALMSPKKLFDASKRATAERSTVSPSAFFKTYRCGHDQTPVCCYKGVEPSDDTCFNAFSGTGGAATTAPFTCQAVNTLRPGAVKGICYKDPSYTPATHVV